jgi:hypothetical protein
MYRPAVCLLTLLASAVSGLSSARACDVTLTQLDDAYTANREAVAPGRLTLTPSYAALSCIAVWLVDEFGLPMARESPRIEIEDEGELARLRLGDSVPNQAHDILALYDDATRTIHVSEEWSKATPAALSVLIHEMVHHLQNLGEMTYECAEAREKTAYDAQERWLSRSGKSLESEFGIDPMTRLMRTRCIM